jgi:hypothetical protein
MLVKQFTDKEWILELARNRDRAIRVLLTMAKGREVHVV